MAHGKHPPPNAQKGQNVLTIASIIAHQIYPVNAKFHLKEIEKLPVTTFCRVQDDCPLTETFKTVRQMNELCNDAYGRYCK